ncbi:hypothetical protein OXX79_004895 [Metschnikowia pulcherrima]
MSCHFSVHRLEAHRMPRVSPKLIRKAFSQNPLLPPLLKATHNLDQATAELRWIQKELPHSKWKNAVSTRSRHEPLQYILGTQPFGPLEILCEKNVLIPRWETEEWATELARAINHSANSNISILDACTGSGCIPLLLKYLVPDARVRAFDFSEHAVQLSLRNKDQAGLDIDIWRADLFNLRATDKLMPVDLITANPPYVPAEDYEKPVALNGPEKSVKLYEPREALIGHLEFYDALIDNLAKPLESKGIIFELGYEDQVIHTARKLPSGWKCGRFVDSSNNVRCVVAWEDGSSMSFLRDVVNGGYLES